ncbi:MAG: hypothetical protein HRU08_02880, partial [Oleispira sp.]|nr:hypothetical protein [Oleispira sp.]
FAFLVSFREDFANHYPFYNLVHKSWLESFGAIFFGFLLGILALRSKSIWGGIGVHVAIALMMDCMAMWQTKGFPEQFMR